MSFGILCFHNVGLCIYPPWNWLSGFDLYTHIFYQIWEFSVIIPLNNLFTPFSLLDSHDLSVTLLDALLKSLRLWSFSSCFFFFFQFLLLTTWSFQLFRLELMGSLLCLLMRALEPFGEAFIPSTVYLSSGLSLVSLQVFYFLLITSFHWYVVFLASFSLCAFFLCLIEHILDGCFKSLSAGFLGRSLYQDFCSFGLTYFLYFFVHCHFLVETWTFDCYDVVTLEIRLFFPSIWFVFICFYCGRLS